MAGPRDPGRRPLRPTLDLRARAGRLAAVLYAVAALTVVVTLPFLPAGTRTTPLLSTAAAGAVTAAVCLVAPWSRWRSWTTLVPYLWGQVLIGAAVGAWAGALSHYLLFYALAAIYAGLTQSPRRVRWLAVVTLASPAVALLGREPMSSAVDLVGAAVLSVVVAEVLARATARAERATSGTQALLHAVASLHERSDADADAADLVAELAQALLAPDLAVVMVATGDEGRLFVNRGQRGVQLPLGTLVVDATTRSGLGLAVRERRAMFVRDAAGSPLLARSAVARLGLASVLFVPVPGGGEVLGCVVLGWRRPLRRLEPFAEQVVGLLASQAASSLARQRSQGQLRQQARSDALTGLANRRVFLEALDRLRPGGAVAFLDLDHFKKLNDTRGHAAGDATLMAFAEALRQSVRAGDCAARYGGEEFALVLPSAASVDMTAAAQVAVQRLRDRWQGPVTFSAGIAVHRAGEAPSTTLARADAAVYQAKARGRDTVVVADPAGDLLLSWG